MRKESSSRQETIHVGGSKDGQLGMGQIQMGVGIKVKEKEEGSRTRRKEDEEEKGGESGEALKRKIFEEAMKRSSPDDRMWELLFFLRTLTPYLPSSIREPSLKMNSLL